MHPMSGNSMYLRTFSGKQRAVRRHFAPSLFVNNTADPGDEEGGQQSAEQNLDPEKPHYEARRSREATHERSWPLWVGLWPQSQENQ